ncbi:hypothetical protein PFI31113_02281 [Pandoraea fibrosis]|uniref:Uncharacterized protein n=1 Tax=Pandoraea fibrosis TaxID=1891094 RepID=A0A5E4UY02_9BURK|nr:hypothetical protein PFI31113_02281 [Pandoraea fibrosis]
MRSLFCLSRLRAASIVRPGRIIEQYLDRLRTVD